MSYKQRLTVYIVNIGKILEPCTYLCNIVHSRSLLAIIPILVEFKVKKDIYTIATFYNFECCQLLF